MEVKTIEVGNDKNLNTRNYFKNKTSLVFYSLRSQNPLHLGGGRPLSVRLRLPPLPFTGEPAPEGKARLFSSGEHTPKVEANCISFVIYFNKMVNREKVSL